MKTLTSFIFAFLILQAKGYLIKVPTSNQRTIDTAAPLGWVHVQKLLLPLFENVCEESSDPLVVRLSDEFIVNSASSNYLQPEVFENLHNLISNNLLRSKGEIFTELKEEHKNELKSIYEVLFYAKDFDTFYRAACWARQNLNCGLFVDALYLAIINRKDIENIFMPAPYEVLPNYFVQKDYIVKASSLVGEDGTNFEGVRVEGNSYILDVNYTNNLYDDSYNNLNYFHEDIDLNTYYFLTKLKSFQWSNNLEIAQNKKWGENLYSIIKHLVTRYDLERYSNDLPEIDAIDWDNLNDFLYDPKLIYSNGNEFNQRSSVNTNETLIMKIRNIENNISAIVMNMRENELMEKTEILNCLMDILVTGESSYEKLALKLLSNVGSFTGSYSVLSHYLTMARDPILWKLNKKIVELVENALITLPMYLKNQVYFPGVEIISMDVKKILTSFENFEFDLTDALKTQEIESTFQIKVSQYRLTHKPFSLKINIFSRVVQKALVKLFIGPKVLPGEFINRKNQFMPLDCFEINLKLGNNVITRASLDINNLAKDFVSLKTIRKYLLDAEFGIDTVPSHLLQSQVKFPARLILPKGTSEGLPLQIFAFVAPFVKTTIVGSRNYLESNSDTILSPGYPLDLDLENLNLLELPNAFFKDILLTHKTAAPTTNYNSVGTNDIYRQSDNSEYPRNYNLQARPSFNKSSFDYKAKKEKYGKNNVHTNKSTTQNLEGVKIYDQDKNQDTEIRNTVANNTTKNSTIYENKSESGNNVKFLESNEILGKNDILLDKVKTADMDNMGHTDIFYNKYSNLTEKNKDISLTNEIYEVDKFSVDSKDEVFF